MIDEEMAEKFASSGYALGCTKSPFETAKEAYLAGLKAGRPKWHKVADGDLPSVCSIVLDECCNKVWYVGNGKWLTYSEFYEKTIGTNPPIAWCEEPEYIED